MKKKQSNYSIGLDIGTSSVGFAVIKEDYSLVKARSKNYWGVHLFSEGETSESRRVKRSSRRRLARRKQRIALLRMLIGEEILKIDPNFFHRLDVSALNVDDKKEIYGLFEDSDFNDVNYFEKFPTIYHLRKHLMESKEKEDMRLVYLAIAHILKHRGHFLFEGQSFNLDAAASNLESLIQEMIEICGDNEKELLVASIANILMKKESLKDRKKELEKLLVYDKDSKNPLCDALIFSMGSKIEISKVSTEEMEATGEKISFNEKSYEEILEKARELGIDTQLIESAYKIYSVLMLKDILENSDSLSDKMVSIFNDHKIDLEELKKIIRTNDAMAFKRIFKDDGKGSYQAYMKSGKTSQEDFYAEVKKIFAKKDLQGVRNERIEVILDKIDKKIYLDKQRTKRNAIIPYQVHEHELSKILFNQSMFYPTLKENSDKIVQLLKFRIPYYVGPLNPHHNKFAWVTRKVPGLVTPWNFEDKVDVEKSASDFIRRMTNTCTYIIGEPVLPKQSLMYARFELYNELNNLRIEVGNDKKKLELDAKQLIIDQLFLKKKSVSIKDIQNLLITRGMMGSDNVIVGNADETKLLSSLAAEIELRKIYEDTFEQKQKEIETLIEWITVYEDKDILKRRILKEMPHLEKDIQNILILKFSGWGRLSKKLLNDIPVSYDGFEYSILQCLEISKMNFMEILHDKDMGLEKKLSSMNFEENISKLKYNHIEVLSTSPKNKRAIYRSTQVIEEIVKYMGSEPESIFLEFARSEEVKERTQSRKNQLLRLFENNKVVSKEIKNYDEKDFDERLFLYFMQECRCMYTGKKLEISEINGKPSLSQYDVDHIIPRSIIKDDSLDNKVLVYANANKEKSNKLVLDKEVIQENIVRWKNLQERGLISSKKFYNLTRSEFTDRDVERFINRQLVETRQISKHVRDLLKKRFSNTKVLTVKASLVSDFRNNYDFIKIRGLNNVHHAHDAYLVGLIGMYIKEKYPNLLPEMSYQTKSRDWSRLIIKFNTSKDKNGFILNSMRRSSVDASEKSYWNGLESIDQIRERLFYKDYFITRMLEKTTGKFYNETLQQKAKDPKLIARNNLLKDTSKYGGFTSQKPSYGMIVRHNGKLKLISIPVYIDKLSQTDKYAIDHYLNNLFNNEKIQIVKDQILWNQKFDYMGGTYRLSSDIEWANAKEVLIGKNNSSLLVSLEKLEKNDHSIEDCLRTFDFLASKILEIYPIFTKKKIEEIIGFGTSLSKMPKDKQSQFISALLKGLSAGKSTSEFKCDESGVKFTEFGRIKKGNIDVTEATFHDESITGVFTKTYKIV